MPTRHHAAVAAAFAAAACSGPETAPAGEKQPLLGMPTAAPTARTLPMPGMARDDALPMTSVLGRWVGVEGMFLDVTAKPGGGVRIENQWDLDHRGVFDGMAGPRGLRWVRDGKPVFARPGNGDATGLKWLAGKTDCLIVAPGEGYCRS